MKRAMSLAILLVCAAAAAQAQQKDRTAYIQCLLGNVIPAFPSPDGTSIPLIGKSGSRNTWRISEAIGAKSRSYTMSSNAWITSSSV